MENKGRVVILPPVKVGDTVFCIVNDKIIDATVAFLLWENHELYGIKTEIRAKCGNSSISARFEDFGKTMFLTCEEAKETLKATEKERKCDYALVKHLNELGEEEVYCRFYSKWVNIKNGNCFGKCEAQNLLYREID